MDVLSEVLSEIRLDGAVYLDGEFTAPWCVEAHYGQPVEPHLLTSANHIAYFHLLIDGRCEAKVAGSPEVLELGAGDLVVFVKDRGHTMGSDVSLKPQGGKDLVGLRAGNLMSVRHGGGGALTRFVCGYVACDKRICQPLIGCLPPMFSVGIGADSTSAWLTHLLQVGVQESLAQRPGARSLLAKISELLFVEAMRRYAASLPSEQKGWLAGLRDPYVGKAVGRLHADVARAWTLDVLASEVGLSRSALSERFSDLIGEAPMQYLTRWRMALAARALRTQSDLIARVAERCGYESEAAFNRAFKREFGAPPAAWRRLEQRGSGIVSGSADSSSVC